MKPLKTDAQTFITFFLPQHPKHKNVSSQSSDSVHCVLFRICKKELSLEAESTIVEPIKETVKGMRYEWVVEESHKGQKVSASIEE